MALFNPVITQTPEQLQAGDVLNAANGLLSYLIGFFNAQYAKVWDQPNPAGVIAAFGTQALAVFTQSYLLGQYINSVQTAAVNNAVPAGWTVTFDAAGNATAVYTAPPPAGS